MNHILPRVLCLAVVTALASPGAMAVVLEVGKTSAQPGGTAEIVVSINSADTALGALVFSVGFDRDKLRFDGSAKTGDQLSNVSVEAPQGYFASSTVLPHSGGDAIAVSIVRTGVASPLRGGHVRLRFEAWPDAQGSAWVGVLPGASAASTLGELAPVSVIDGYVSIETPEPALVVTPSVLAFESTPSSAALMLSNRGSLPMTVTAVHVSDPAFVLEPIALPLTIAPGASLALAIEAHGSGDATGELTIEAAANGNIRSRVPLTLDLESEGRGTSSFQWILPSIPGAHRYSILLNDPEQTSTVACVSPDQTEIERLDLKNRQTTQLATRGEAWYLVESGTPTVRAVLVDAAGDHITDAVRMDQLPTGTASITAVDPSSSSLIAANISSEQSSIELAIHVSTGEIVHRDLLKIAPYSHQRVELPRLEGVDTVTVVLHQKSAGSSITAWLVETSPSGISLRVAR